MENQRLTVHEASKVLGISDQFLRYLLQQRKIDVGVAVKNSKNSGFRYLIFKSKVEEFVGNNGFETLARLESGNE